MTAAAIADVTRAVSGWRYAQSSEASFHDGLEEALRRAELPVDREVDLGPGHGRIDLLCDRIGIEVKVAGSAAAIIRQLTRYATSGRLDGLVLITSRVRHTMPHDIEGIPVVTISTTLGVL